MEKFGKGDRVSFVGDPVAGTRVKGTVMQFVQRVSQYEIHTDVGSILHLAEADLKAEKNSKGKDDKDE